MLLGKSCVCLLVDFPFSLFRRRSSYYSVKTWGENSLGPHLHRALRHLLRRSKCEGRPGDIQAR
jgi:hypothetical protein